MTSLLWTIRLSVAAGAGIGWYLHPHYWGWYAAIIGECIIAILYLRTRTYQEFTIRNGAKRVHNNHSSIPISRSVVTKGEG